MLAGILVLALVEAYWPFAWDPPGTVTNDVRRTADGTLSFGDHNAARTATTPSWLPTVRRSERIRIDLVVRPAFPQRYDDASVMMLASDSWHADFDVAQDRGRLMFWLRRVGTDAEGAPPFAVADAFRPGRWTHLRITVDGDVMRVAVDGATRLRTTLPAGSLRTWARGLLVLGDEVHGGIGWHGEIRRAAVSTDAGTVEYLRRGALVVPHRYFYLPDHVSPFPPTSRLESFALVLHLISFVPIGFLLVWCRRRPARGRVDVLLAVTIAVGIAIVLAAGKLLFHERHLAVADLVVQLSGALAGAYLAYLARRAAGRSRA